MAIEKKKPTNALKKFLDAVNGQNFNKLIHITKNISSLPYTAYLDQDDSSISSYYRGAEGTAKNGLLESPMMEGAEERLLPDNKLLCTIPFRT